MNRKTVLVLGGDGFCGWPTALHLSNAGYDVVIVDNFSRRKIDVELGADSLTPIAPMTERLRAWESLSGKKVRFHEIDIAMEYPRLLELLLAEKPGAIVHFAEQRSAPYSMKGARQKIYTVSNNLNATHNLLCAMVESGIDAHLVHLGTMGVYGYSTADVKLPEGYLRVQIPTRSGGVTEREILYPAAPGSIYHMTKCQDQIFFYFYNKNDGLKITDLHQGIVWGTNTAETIRDEALLNRFDYDGDYGTVLNRFLMQAAVGHPLTVNGTGGQTRAFIHIQDTARCIELAIAEPPKQGERVRIFNQMTETHRVRDLARMVSEMTGAKIEFLPNPRKEDAENELWVENQCLLDRGLKPITLQKGLMMEVSDIAKKFSNRCDLSKIQSRSYWTRDIAMQAESADGQGPAARAVVR